jgi:uncharacterized protein YjbK
MIKEYELKYMLTDDEYHMLERILDRLPSVSEIQTNYYYDTESESLRKQNVTVRVREKNNKYQGTIKRHLADGCSTEENFRMKALQNIMMFEGENIYMKGSLETKRTTYYLSDDVMIMLDRNEYLDNIDYELEVECPKEFMEQAKGIVFLIKELLHSERMESSIHKSERFFRRLNNKTI